MNITNPPIPVNERDRLKSLSDLDVDYSALQENFKDLTKLAAKVAGTDISLVNLIDTFTQWTISDYGIAIEQMPREDSVCQYTIMEEESFEVKDLSADDRFKDKDYVKSKPNLKYYLGIPLKTNDGCSIGALCVLDNEVKLIEPEKIELLKIIAGEIVNRLKTLKIIESLKYKVVESRDAKLKVAHDIRGPLSGIIGLAQLISEQGDQNKLDDVLEFIGMIQKSGDSILELATEILTEEKKTKDAAKAPDGNQFNLLLFKDKLEKLYKPQSINKKIDFTVSVKSMAANTPFYKNKLLQITGNLISNAIKFTPANGFVAVELDLISEQKNSTLHIAVKDSGVGIGEAAIENLMSGAGETTNGTSGEQGYGFGLVLVKHLVDSLNGTMKIYSKPNEGTTFEIQIPQA